MRKVSFENQGLSKRGWTIIKIVLAAILLFFVLKKIDPSALRSSLSLSPVWLLANFGAFLAMLLLKGLQYKVLLGEQEPYPAVLKVIAWQSAISNFVATSAGIASYMAMLKAERNVKLRRSGVVFLLVKFGDLLAIAFYLMLAAAWVWGDIAPLRWLTVLLALGTLGGAFAFLVVVLGRQHFVRLVTKILSWMKLTRSPWAFQGLAALHALAQESQTLIVRMLGKSIGLSFLYMTVTMIFAYTGMQIFHVQVNPWAIFYVASVMQLVSFIPIQVLGGLGVSEITAVYLYGVFGLDQGKISAVMLGLRAIFYSMNAIILLSLLLETSLRRRLSR